MIILKDVSHFNKLVAIKGYSKRAFAKKCGLNESTFIQISNGKQSPRPHNAKKIVESLGVEFEDVFCFRYAFNQGGELNVTSTNKC